MHENVEAVACPRGASARLWEEFNRAQKAMEPADRALLAEHGVAIGNALFLVGAAHIRIDKSRELFEPDDGGSFAYLTPIMVGTPDTPEAVHPAQAVRFGDLVDLIAWHPAHPSSWALRIGAAEWLGAIEPQYLDPPPVPVFRNVLSWLQGGARGLVPLCRTPEALRRVLVYCARIGAQDKAHAIELRRALRLPWNAPPVSVRTSREA